MKIDKLIMEKRNRVLRFGFGQHNGTWFIRLDIWWVGFRLSEAQDR